MIGFVPVAVELAEVSNVERNSGESHYRQSAFAACISISSFPIAASQPPQIQASLDLK